MSELRARVLSNVHLPSVPGFSIQTFGKYLSAAAPAAPIASQALHTSTTPIWRAEMERRRLSEILPLIPQNEQPDILLISSPEYLPIPVDIADFPGLKILLITDWNVCLRFLPDLCPLFDFCFTDWPGYRLLKKSGVTNIHHQPMFGHDPERFRCLDVGLNLGLSLELKRNLDVSFCGNLNSGLHGERNRLLARLAKWGASKEGRTVHLRQAFDDEYVAVLNRSKMVFNYSIRGEANMRLFESMATGAVALVEESNQEVGILFQENTHYFRYAPGGLEDRLNTLLADPARLASVSAAARDAVGQHTKSRQLQNLLEMTCHQAPLKLLSEQVSTGQASTGMLQAKLGPASVTRSQLKEQKSLLKLRVLGAGYTLAEALEEIQMRSQECPGLARETLPATLLSVLTPQSPDALPAAIRMLGQFLDDPLYPETLRAFFSMTLSVLHSQWTDVLNHAIRCMELLTVSSQTVSSQTGASQESESVWILYGHFYPPIGLGKGFNSDLNHAYQQDLATGKPQSYLDLLFAHCCVNLAKAYQAVGKHSDSVTELQRLPLSRFASLEIHPALLSDLLQVGDRDGALHTAKEWFALAPLDTGIWNPIYNAYAQLGEKTTTIRFLEEIEILAEAFLNADQIAMIRDLLIKERAEKA